MPQIEDDFDWMVRDYDSFRLFMMEELAHDHDALVALDADVLVPLGHARRDVAFPVS